MIKNLKTWLRNRSKKKKPVAAAARKPKVSNPLSMNNPNHPIWQDDAPKIGGGRSDYDSSSSRSDCGGGGSSSSSDSCSSSSSSSDSSSY